jgi:hypothetical protein
MLPLLPAGRSRDRGWEDGQGTKNAGPLVLETPRWKWSYAAVRFAALACAFLGTGRFAAFAWSLAANSCLTLAAMSSVSTLYTVAASRKMCEALCVFGRAA